MSNQTRLHDYPRPPEQPAAATATVFHISLGFLLTFRLRRPPLFVSGTAVFTAGVAADSRGVAKLGIRMEHLGTGRIGPDSLIRVMSLEHRHEVHRHFGLSPREGQVLDRVLEDQSEARIAMDLGISEHTVHTHVKRIYRKLGVSTRTMLITTIVASYLAIRAAEHEG